MSWGTILKQGIKVFSTCGDDAARVVSSQVGKHAASLSDDVFRAANGGTKSFNAITAGASRNGQVYMAQGFNRVNGLNGAQVNRYTTAFPDGRVLVDSVSSNGVRQAAVMQGNKVIARGYGQQAAQDVVKKHLLPSDNGRFLTGTIDGISRTNQGGFVSYLRYV